MQIKAILFDLDGTLANTLPLCIKAYKHAFEHYLGHSVTDEEVTTHFGLTEEGIFQRALPDQWETALKIYYEVYEHLHDECSEPFVGIEDALRLLKQRGIAMAVVTGKGAYTAHLTLKYLGLADYFDMVEAGDANAVVKALAMRKILATWGIDPQDAAYVGDTDTDMTQATAAGLLPLGACWAETATIQHNGTTPPITTFSSIQAFTRWLDEHVEPINV
jgi:phosphoglycolate phosphatase-like HAD superfamily hydrolase